VELRFTALARGIASALLATVLAVMLLAHSAPTPSDHTTPTASSHSNAHLCDDLSHPEEAAGHYWTRASHHPAPVSRRSSTTDGTSALTKGASSTGACGPTGLGHGALRQPAASRPSVLQVFRC
jgi:hypothetical protein